MNGRPWNQDEWVFLRESYSVGMAVSEIAEVLDRTENAVRIYSGLIRLRRPAWFISDVRSTASRKRRRPGC